MNFVLGSFKSTKARFRKIIRSAYLSRPIFMYKEELMVEVTESATQKIGEYFEGKEISPIRIFLNEGG